MLVDQVLNTRGWSVRRCSEEYVKYRKAHPKPEAPTGIGKDTIHRIRRGQFEVVNRRVAALCDFLNINLFTSQPSDPDKHCRFANEFAQVEALAEKEPSLVKTLKLLLRNINDIATIRG